LQNLKRIRDEFPSALTIHAYPDLIPADALPEMADNVFAAKLFEVVKFFHNPALRVLCEFIFYATYRQLEFTGFMVTFVHLPKQPKR